MVEHSEEAGNGGDGQPVDIHEARIVGSFEQLDRLLRTAQLDVGCSHPHFDQIDSKTVSLLIYATLPQVEELRGDGYAVQLGENVSERADKLKAEIATGDRFEGGRVPPRGFGVKSTGRELK